MGWTSSTAPVVSVGSFNPPVRIANTAVPQPTGFLSDPLSGSVDNDVVANWTSLDGTYWLHHLSGVDYIGPKFVSGGGISNSDAASLTSVIYAENDDMTRTPRTAEYDVRARVYRFGTRGLVHICGRFLPSQAGGSSYQAVYSAPAGEWKLMRIGGTGSPVTIGTYVAAIPLSGFVDVELRCRNDRKSLYVDGIERVFSTTDNVLAQPGTVAVIFEDCRASDGLTVTSIFAQDLDPTARRTHYVTHFDAIPIVSSSPIVAATNGNWNSSSTWQGGSVPTSTDNVFIPAGKIVTVVTTGALARAVQVEGILTFDPTATTSMTCRTIYVDYTGALITGTEANPVQSGVTCTITIEDASIDTTNDPAQYGHGFVIAGKWRSCGATKTPFVRCSTELTASQTSITLSTSPSGWNNGDALVFPDSRHLDPSTETLTNYTHNFDEKTIDSISGTALTLGTGLTFAHPGASNAAGTLTFTPHVLNMTRNVVVQSANHAGTRAHAIAVARADINLRYTSGKDMGRTTQSDHNNTVFGSDGVATSVGTNQIGRYPLIHFHHVSGDKTGTRSWQYEMVGCVVDNTLSGNTHTRKWGITVHDSHWGLIRDNITYNTAGFGIGTEDGNESGNLFEGNFMCRVRGRGFRVSDDVDSTVGVGREGAGLWQHGPNNYTRNNVVSGVWAPVVYSYGYIYAQYILQNIRIPESRGKSTIRNKDVVIMFSNHMPIPEFQNNEAYGAMQSFGTVWHLGTVAGQNVNLNQQWTIFKDCKAWNFWDMTFFQYELVRLRLDNWTVIGKKSLLQAGNGAQGIVGNDYLSREFVIQNCTFENLRHAWYVSEACEASEIRDCIVRCQNVSITETLWTSSAQALNCIARDFTIRNVLHDVTNVPSPGPCCKHVYSAAPVRNLILVDSLKIYNFNQVPDDDYEIFFTQQASTFVVPQTIIDGPNTSLKGSPDAGLTNQQNWDTYGIAIGGKIASCTTTNSTITDGYACAI